MTKYVFFDLDNTLTPSKSRIREEDIATLKKLTAKKEITVASGHGPDIMRDHLTAELTGLYHVLGQNGNHAETKDGRILWNNELSDIQRTAILAFCKNIHDELRYKVRNENDLIEDRGSQITYSLIGHHENFSIKTAFDPGAVKRNNILASYKEEVRRLKDLDIDVVPGGTTGLDFFLAGHNKGFNISQFIERMGWKKSESLYIGDALFPGGNDESVRGVIETHAVAGPEDTFRYIQEHLLS